MSLELPPRYAPLAQLGKGGGGEVWSVRDRLTERSLALKTLGAQSDEHEVQALVREAAALSGLEGLGVPRVLRFGRLPKTGRPYLLRELVEGSSLAGLLEQNADPRAVVAAVLDVADQLTRLHRAQLLHGDVKPANVIVPPAGPATLVDLGLVAAFREGGTRPLGLTPRYAAPELFEGGALTVRSEVFALGATLADVLDKVGARLGEAVERALSDVAARATRTRPEDRYPSVDEVASAMRRAAPDLLEAEPTTGSAAWPIVGLEAPSRVLHEQVKALAPGGGVVVTGPVLSGKTTLLRRLAWSLGVEGRHVAWVEGGESAEAELDLEIAGATPVDVVVLVDDAERLPPSVGERLGVLREGGARVVVVTGAGGDVPIRGATLEVFEIPPLDVALSRELSLRAVPSLPEPALARVIEITEGRPGRLRAVVGLLDGAPVVGADDIDRLVPPDLFSASKRDRDRARPLGKADLHAIREALLRGHFEDAAELLATRDGEPGFELGVMRAKLFTNQGEWKRAQGELAALDLGDTDAGGALDYFVELARANLRGGDYASCVKAAELAESRVGREKDARSRAGLAEALALGGMALSFLGELERAQAFHDHSIENARALGDARVLSVALSSAAFSLQRQGKLEEARPLYEEALANAETAGDAGTVATTRLNLAGIAKAQGDLARALVHLEAAVDMGRRSGRRATLRQALLNLANLDLYLGRLSRALVSIEHLAAERHELPPSFASQLLGLESEAALKSGDLVRAEALCIACARAYEAVGRRVDAAEAQLESVFVRLARPQGAEGQAEIAELRRRLAEIGPALSEVSSHRAALELARGRVAALSGDPSGAREAYDRSIEAAVATGKKDWLARAYQARAMLSVDEGQLLAARRDREAALGVLEEIAARLPRDLREVFWDDPNRRGLREGEAGKNATLASPLSAGTSVPTMATMQTRVTHERLARLLEVNRELAGTYDLRRLLERLTDHAIALLSAERGFVILKSQRDDRQGDLSIHASRDQAGDDPHARFSQSIADRVIRTGEPVVTASARDDARMADYVSVHQLMLQSIACVPIRSRSSGTIGALYLETRMRSASTFAEDLPLLVAMADQAAIGIETARLVGENEARARELEKKSAELEAARAKLEELLGHRTAQLQQTRRDLKSARAVLKSHFGYEGLVGTSEAMRRVYALIDRVKDTDVPVLITGESGTGKEVIARAIHNASPRAKKPFLAINCGAIPEHLLESELFGHVRGAFTGADRDRKGLFREATEGSLMLDEIGEMPPKMQAGLLRVLQEKVVRPVGGAREEPTATRVIAATHRDLEAMVQRGAFREDLFYRLNVIQVRAPSLRERAEDIPILIDHFLGIFAARYNRERRSVSRAALKMLSGYRWPGNVRQLENALLNAWVLSDTPELEPEDFELTDLPVAPARLGPAPAAAAAAVPVNLDAHRASERDRILQALAASNWNRVRAAEICGMPRRTFYRRLKEYGIQ